MKQLLLVFILSFSVTVVAQPEKDSLLAQDHDKVLVQLRMMRYLDSIVTDQTILARSSGKPIHQNFYKFYLDTIAKQSPFGLRSVSDYLGYEGSKGPVTAKEFNDRVARKNVYAVIALTQKYGYITSKRLRMKGKITKHTSLTTYLWRDNAYLSQFAKLFEEEYRLGNLTEPEYTFFRIRMKGAITEEDEKVLKKHNVKQIQKRI